MNLLSIGASLGVIVAIFQWGWAGSVFGVQPGPIESFIPVMLFAIVFGLSMDYEVFLVSRIHERWTITKDSSRAVSEGLALTGRVVSAAATIMVFVFLSFMLGEDRVIKEFGLALASAVFLDALVIRCLLLPATLHLLKDSTWWIPRWLDRILPQLNIEGSSVHGRAARRERAGRARRRPAADPGAPRGPRQGIRRLRPALRALACAVLGAGALGGMPAAAAARRPSAVIAFAPVTERQLARLPGMAVGIMSASQGTYSRAAASAGHHARARGSTPPPTPRPGRRCCR